MGLFDYSGSPEIYQLRDSWNAAQRAQGLPVDDQSFQAWLAANSPAPAPAAAPQAQAPASPPLSLRGVNKLPFLFQQPMGTDDFGGGSDVSAAAPPVMQQMMRPQTSAPPVATPPVAVPQTAPMLPPQAQLRPPSAGGKSPFDPRGMIPTIREAATKYGIDPDTAIKVAQSEGLGNPVGDHGQSHGSFQLYMGGGEGNLFQQATGLDPRDPKNEAATIDWAMKRVAQNGWGAWHGAKKVGVGNWDGVGGERSPGGDVQVASPRVGPGLGATSLAELEQKPLQDPQSSISKIASLFSPISSAQAQEMPRTQPNLAATLAHMAGGFLSGKGPADSLGRGFSAMGEGLNHNQDRMDRGQLAQLGQASHLQQQQQSLAKLLLSAGVPLGDALAQAGMAIPNDRRLELNRQSQPAPAAPAAPDDGIDRQIFGQLVRQGVSPSVAAKAARHNASPEDIAAADPEVNSTKPLPAAVQKMADKQIEGLQSIRQNKATIEQLQDEVYAGRLNLNRFNQFLQKGKAAVGLTDEEVVNYQKYNAALHSLQSDELRKNAGVQTDADAEREMQRLTGGGITSSDQFIKHTNYLLNQWSLGEQSLRQRHEQTYARSKQKLPEGYWDSVESTLPGSPPKKSPKEISSDMYGDHSGKQRALASPQAVGDGKGIGLSTDDQNLIGKYLKK